MRLKIPFTMFLLVAVCSVATAQKASLQIPAEKIIDTTATYNWFKANVNEIGLKDLMRSKDKLRFRFWSKNQLVEIWSSNQNTFLGELVSYTSKYDPHAYSKPGKKDKIFTKHIAIDTTVAKRIYEQAMDVAIFDIPAQGNIKGWKQGVDGYSVILEYSDPLRYNMKDYWSPDFQVALPEAKLIDDFQAFLEANLGLREKWNTFIHGLPKGCYSAGGVILCIGRKEALRLRKQH